MPNKEAQTVARLMEEGVICTFFIYIITVKDAHFYVSSTNCRPFLLDSGDVLRLKCEIN